MVESQEKDKCFIINRQNDIKSNAQRLNLEVRAYCCNLRGKHLIPLHLWCNRCVYVIVLNHRVNKHPNDLYLYLVQKKKRIISDFFLTQMSRFSPSISHPLNMCACMQGERQNICLWAVLFHVVCCVYKCVRTCVSLCLYAFM